MRGAAAALLVAAVVGCALWIVLAGDGAGRRRAIRGIFAATGALVVLEFLG